MKFFYFFILIFTLVGCLPKAEISIKNGDLTADNSTVENILTLKYTNKGSGALSATSWQVGFNQEFIPTTTGGTPTLFSISPSLPAGFIFNTTTGAISGAPQTHLAPAQYIITASNNSNSITQIAEIGGSYGSFAFTVVFGSATTIYANKNVSIGVSYELNDISSLPTPSHNSCKIETITGDDLTTLTGISYDSTNCKITSTATPTQYLPTLTTFIATVTRSDDQATASNSIDVQVLDNPVITSFTIDDGQGPSGVMDSRGGTINVTGVNFQTGDEFYDTTNPTSEVLLNGVSCSTVYSSSSIKCLLSNITPGLRKFKIKRATGASDEKSFTVYNTAPTIEVLTANSFPTNSQKAYAFDSFPFDTTIDFKISTGPTEVERNAETSIIEFSTNRYGAPESFIDWQQTHCTQSNLAGGFKKLSCTLKPKTERAYGLVNLKLTAYETLDPLKTVTIEGDYVRYPLNLLSTPSGTLTKGEDPFINLMFDFKISNITQFKNFLEIVGGYSPYLKSNQMEEISGKGHKFTFENLDFSQDTTFQDFLTTHLPGDLNGELLGNCQNGTTLSSIPLTDTNGVPVPWLNQLRGKISCITFDRIEGNIGGGNVENYGLIARNGIIESDSDLALTGSSIDFTDSSVTNSGLLFGQIGLYGNLRIDTSKLTNGVLTLPTKNTLRGSGEWQYVGLIAGSIGGAGSIYGNLSGTIVKSGGSSSFERFGLLSGSLSSNFGIPTTKSNIRATLALSETKDLDSHGYVGVIAGTGSDSTVSNSQFISTILSSGKNLNEAGIFGFGQRVTISNVMNDIHFLKNGSATIKGAGAIGGSQGEIIFNQYNSSIFASEYNTDVLSTFEGGFLISNCQSGAIRLTSGYFMSPKITNISLTQSNNCEITGPTNANTAKDLIIIGISNISASELSPISSSISNVTKSATVTWTNRLDDIPSWLKNCLSTSINSGGDVLYGFCLGGRELIPEEIVGATILLNHYSDLLSLPGSDHFSGGEFNLGSSLNLEGFTHLFLSNFDNQDISFTLNGGGHKLLLPKGNMPFFTATISNSTFTNIKIFKDTETGISNELWRPIENDFYSGNGRSLIFNTFRNSSFSGHINLNLSYDINAMDWSGTSLIGYELNDSTFSVHLEGKIETFATAPSSPSLFRFSSFYKGIGSIFEILSNNIQIDLTVRPENSDDSSSGIDGTWGFGSQPAQTYVSQGFNVTGPMNVYYLNSNMSTTNLCQILDVDSMNNLSCSPTSH